MLEKFQTQIEYLHSQIKPTIDNRTQFETNCKSKFSLEKIVEAKNKIEEYQKLIGKDIFKYKNSFGYSIIPNPDIWNKTEDAPVLFTKELFNQLKIEALNRWIKYYTDILLEGELSQSSTSKLGNLQFEWYTKETQNFISFLKTVLFAETKNQQTKK